MASRGGPPPEDGQDTLVPPRPSVERVGDDFVVRWGAPLFVSAEAVRVYEHSNGDVHSESLWAQDRRQEGSTGLIHRARYNLQATTARNTMTAALQRMWRGTPVAWSVAVEQFCNLVIDTNRELPPGVDLFDVPRQGKTRYLVDGILPQDEVTVVYGDGGVGKSTLVQTLGLCVASGISFAGRHSVLQPGPVAYLDWEAGGEGAYAERAYRICEGLGVALGQGWMRYYPLQGRYLVDAAAWLRKEFAKRPPALVIADSLGYACSGDPSEAAPALQTMSALRSLGVTVVATAHVAKSGGRTIFGSAFWRNSARMAWEMRSGEADGPGRGIVLYNEKANYDAVSVPLPLVVEQGTSITYRRGAVVREPEKLTLSGRILKLIDKLAMPVKDISLSLDVAEATARKTLARMADEGLVRRIAGDGGLVRYGVATSEAAGQQERLVSDEEAPVMVPDAPVIPETKAQRSRRLAEEMNAVLVNVPLDEKCTRAGCANRQSGRDFDGALQPLCETHGVELEKALSAEDEQCSIEGCILRLDRYDEAMNPLCARHAAMAEEALDELTT